MNTASIVTEFKITTHVTIYLLFLLFMYLLHVEFFSVITRNNFSSIGSMEPQAHPPSYVLFPHQTAGREQGKGM